MEWVDSKVSTGTESTAETGADTDSFSECTTDTPVLERNLRGAGAQLATNTFCMDTVRLRTRELLGGAAENGKLEHLLEEVGTAKLRRRVRGALLVAANDGLLISTLESVGLPRCTSTLDHPDKVAEKIRFQVQDALSESALDGRLKRAFEGVLARKAQGAAEAEPQGLESLRLKARTTLANSVKGDGFYKALGEARESVEADRKVQVEAPRLDALRVSTAARFAAAAKGGALAAKLAEFRKQPNAPAPPTLDLEHLRRAAQETFHRSALDGTLNEAVQHTLERTQHAAKEQANLAGLKRQAADCFRKLAARGDLEAIFKHVRASAVQKRAKETMLQAAMDGRLEVAFKEVRVKALRARAGKLIKAAAQTGRLSEVIGEVKGRQSDEAADTEDHARSLLKGAALSGSLTKVLAQMRKSQKEESIESLRDSVRKCFAHSACDGRLTTAFADVHSTSLRKRVQETLLSGVETGRLNVALQDMKTNSLRRQVREALTGASLDNRLAFALTQHAPRTLLIAAQKVHIPESLAVKEAMLEADGPARADIPAVPQTLAEESFVVEEATLEANAPEPTAITKTVPVVPKLAEVPGTPKSIRRMSKGGRSGRLIIGAIEKVPKVDLGDEVPTTRRSLESTRNKGIVRSQPCLSLQSTGTEGPPPSRGKKTLSGSPAGLSKGTPKPIMSAMALDLGLTSKPGTPVGRDVASRALGPVRVTKAALKQKFAEPFSSELLQFSLPTIEKQHSSGSIAWSLNRSRSATRWGGL